jgi:exodeoxyribonuclease V beta subunit
MAELPGGASFGTCVHGVLEDADLAGDPAAALAEAAVVRLRRSGLDLSAGDLVAGLLPAVQTPLGPLTGGLTLAQIPLVDQLRELDFELPLVGGDTAADRTVRLSQVADLVRTLPAGDPVAPYAGILAGHTVAGERLRGYLAGSIDLVLRVGGRYVIADHKTNRLGAWDEPLTAWHYRPEALDEAMRTDDYPLQALLYCVALHRFLRWRLPDYDPHRHLGGVLYLFLRGMCGPGVEAGVWSWQPPAELVVALSDLLAGGGR